jgi:hypothetical protein
VSGSLAAGELDFSPETLLKLLLVWLLADPILGAVWDNGVAPNQNPTPEERTGKQMWHRGIYHRLLSPQLPDEVSPLSLFPYTQRGSPSHRLAHRLGQLRYWWQNILRPEAGREFATLVAALGLALLLGAALGRNMFALVLLSITLSWLTVLSHKRDVGKSIAQGPTGHSGFVTLWHAVGEFGIPWLMGATIMGGLSRPAILLGMCYTITYFGLTHYAKNFILIGTGQATAALLLAGLRHPLTAGAMAIFLMPQWGLHVWAAQPNIQPLRQGLRPATSDIYLRTVQPFIILSMLIAVLTIAS